MTSRRNSQGGFTDTSVLLKLLGLTVVIAVVTCCNRWIKTTNMKRNGYVEYDPSNPAFDDPDKGRGFTVRGGGVR
jgi:hypothetical protein